MRPRYQLKDPALRGMLLCNRWAQLRTVTGQTRPPRLDLKGLLARQMTPHIPDSCAATAAIVKAYFQNCFVAMRAPSAMAANFAHTTSGSTAAWPTQVP